MKRCSHCGERKDLELFGRKNSYADGKDNFCRQCRRAYAAAWRAQHPDRMAEYRRRRCEEYRKAHPIVRKLKIVTCPICGFKYKHKDRPYNCGECGVGLKYRTRGRPRQFTDTQRVARRRKANSIDRMRFRDKHPDRAACEGAFAAAKRNGDIQPQPCETCGAEPTEGHHEDYAKPLEIVWLCRPCHLEEHARLRAREAS